MLFDVAALGVATLLRSGHASRLLVTAVIVNPVDAVRTGTLLGIEGSAAFGAASLAFFRITGGSTAAAAYLLVSVGSLAGRAHNARREAARASRPLTRGCQE